MNNNCNNGVTVPPLLVDGCKGSTTNALCVKDVTIYPELGLESNSSQQEINQAQYLAVLNIKATTDNLQTQIDVNDGSETKVTAGTNVTITGTGTTPNPYVVNSTGGTSTLQQVLDEGNYAEIDGGSSYVTLLYGTTNDRSIELSVDNGQFGPTKEASYFNLSNTSNILQNTYLNTWGKIGADLGIPFFERAINGYYTRVRVPSVTAGVDTQINFPAKTILGDYTVNTTPNTTYTVATLPTAVLNDMAIVSDATSPTYLGALTGGGSVVCPVWYNGTAWVSR
jgi:hypothetical protein